MDKFTLNIYKAFGFRKEDKEISFDEPWMMESLKIRHGLGVGDEYPDSIPESKGRITGYDLDPKKAWATGITPHEAVSYVMKNGYGTYVADDGHKIRMFVREDGEPGIQVEHQHHGGRANNIYHITGGGTTDQSWQKNTTREKMAEAFEQRHDKADEWLHHLMEHPDVTQMVGSRDAETNF